MHVQFWGCNPTSENSCEAGQLCCPDSVTSLWGTCQSCCSDRDCIGRVIQPPAGEFGEPHCIDNVCQAYKDGQASQIGEDGYPVFVPSETIDDAKKFRKYTMPRKVFTDDPGDPVFESAWYFDLNEQDESFSMDDVVTNGTHITLPSFQKLHAGYSKKYAPFGEQETGIVTLFMADNEYSVVAQYPKVSFVEKYHTLTFNGDKDIGRGEYVERLGAQQAKKEKEFDLVDWSSKAYLQAVALFSRGTIMSQVHAAVDLALNWQIRRYVDSYFDGYYIDAGTLNPTSSSRWASHSSKAQQAIKLAKDPNFVREHSKSEQHCKHLEQGRGMFTVDYTANTVTIPLGSPVTIFSGEMVNAPSHYLGLNAGTLTAHYDKEKGILQLFMQGYSTSRQYPDAKFPGPEGFAGLYLGPVASGGDYVVDLHKDGRSDVLYSNEQPSDDQTGYLRDDIPDVTLWRHPIAQRCTEDTLSDSFWESIDVAPSANSIFDTLLATRDLLKGTIHGMACATSWMKTDYGEGSHGMDANEIG